MYKTLNPKPQALKAHLVASLDTKADGFKGNGLMYGSVRFLECIGVAYNIITYYISGTPKMVPLISGNPHYLPGLWAGMIMAILS